MSEIQANDSQNNKDTNGVSHIAHVMGFSNGSYKLSDDYEKLWELIKSGHRVPAWIWRSKERNIWTIVEVRTYPSNDTYEIGTRGVSYKSWNGESKEDFIVNCYEYRLLFIEP